ncbi:hypothetical protein ACFQ48_14895 [Hymenobacter caeli]|uniref:Uncharacterized protein n=1 Tax=Hymenobacter caeli TaxID=2735894 RepID=A0ABX2FT88_9BACT|nr:hypothetical protein [Hymenobacter caeli]NRT19610.1 hypothetical protein [Hymenobacter caeli]
MPFISFSNEPHSPRLNVAHLVSLELLTGAGPLPAVRIRASRPEADLTIEFATLAEAQALIAAIVAYSAQGAAAAPELLAPAGAKPRLLAFAHFEADEPYEPGEAS